MAAGEQYVAGGLALNTVLGGTRLSRDVGLFHDSEEAVPVSSARDLDTLRMAGLAVQVGRHRPGFVEATVRDGPDAVLEVQWVRDTAYRFFPLVMNEELGLMLHPFDLATNKVLALVGRVAARDWIDILTCHANLTPFGCLAWAAAGKDPGLGPLFIVEEAARTAHYPAVELDALAFDGPRPDPAALTRTWRAALSEARGMIDALPPEQVGCAVLDREGRAFRGDLAALRSALASNSITFHAGAIRGALPVVHVR